MAWILIERKRDWVPEWVLRLVPDILALRTPLRRVLFEKVDRGRKPADALDTPQKAPQ